MAIRKLCVFPNDPLKAYYEKGEIKDRYFNPRDIFDEIHVITFDKNDIDSKEIKTVAGKAKLNIHCVGKINLKNKNKIKKEVLELMDSIQPVVIRAYNVRLEGWVAAYCSEKLKIPFLLSIHTQIEQKRKILKKKNFKKFLILKLFEINIEPYVIQHAKKILIIYKIIEPYVLKHGGKNLELLHNSIDLKKFQNGKIMNELPKPLIISVGNLSEEKNHECLVKAMKKIDANLLIIGKGEKGEELKRIIESLKIKNRVSIIPSVKYNEIENYYKSADIFALAYDPKLEGIPKPVIEAMGSGLPIVIPHPIESNSEGLEECALFVKREPDDFSKKINQILNDAELRTQLSKNSLKKSVEFDSEVLEDRESKIYLELIKEGKNLNQ